MARDRDLAVSQIAKLQLPSSEGLHCLQTEAETPDLWLGLLREPKAAGSPIGPTLRAVLVEQFHRSFFGPGGFYWRRNLSAVAGFEAEISASQYSDIISANTGASVSGNVFRV